MLGVVSQTNSKNKLMMTYSCEKDKLCCKKKYFRSKLNAQNFIVYVIPSEYIKSSPSLHFNRDDEHDTDYLRGFLCALTDASSSAIHKEIYFDEILLTDGVQALLDCKEIPIPLEHKCTFLSNSAVQSEIASKNTQANNEEDQSLMSAFFERIFNKLIAFHQIWILEVCEKKALLWFNIMQKNTKLPRIMSGSSIDTMRSLKTDDKRSISPNFLRTWQFMNIASAFLLTLYLRGANICILLAANHCFAIIINVATYSYKINLFFKNSIFINDDESINGNKMKLFNWNDDHYNVLKELMTQSTLTYIVRRRHREVNKFKNCISLNVWRASSSDNNLIKPLYFGSAMSCEVGEPFGGNYETIYDSDTDSLESITSHSLSESASFLSVTSMETSYRVPAEAAGARRPAPGCTPAPCPAPARAAPAGGCQLTQEIIDLMDTCKTFYRETREWLTTFVEDTDFTMILTRLNELCPSPSTRSLIQDFMQAKSIQIKQAVKASDLFQSNRFIKDLGQNLAFTFFSSSSIVSAVKV